MLRISDPAGREQNRGLLFANLRLPSSCGAQHRLIRRVPAFEVSNFLRVEHGTTFLRQVVGTRSRPSHVPGVAIRGAAGPFGPGFREHVDAGGLLSYPAGLAENFRSAAGYVDKVLKGTKPGDLPVAQPTKFELAINLRTAGSLGLTVPASVPLRADEAIE
jgi:hypothetical protein